MSVAGCGGPTGVWWPGALHGDEVGEPGAESGGRVPSSRRTELTPRAIRSESL